MDRFVQLHSHSHYSLLDGLATPAEMVAVAKDLGQTAIAITDHGSLAGHRDMQIACRDGGIKPILGVEAYISETDRFDRRTKGKRTDGTNVYNHIILLAKDAAGLRNLHHMSKEAWTTGFYNKPRIDWDLLEECGDGIIVLSGCMSGLISKAFERGEYDVAEQWTKRLADRFEGDFYMEVQPHNPPELNTFLLEQADKYNVMPVATTDCHFTRPEKRWVEDALLILATNPKATDLTYEATKDLEIFERYNALYPDRFMTFENIDVYMMSRTEIGDAMDNQGIKREDVYESTMEIVDKIGDYEFVESRDFLPEVSKTPSKELADKVKAGLVERGLGGKPEYTERAKHEMQVIHEKEFAPYFIIVEDMITWAKSQGIRVGPGRGSAAGSLVCYALGITDVDPIEYGLLFSRFIDASRDDWPDIDVDFEKARRGEVKDYLVGKYGHVASISNFVYFKDKQVIKDAAKVLRVPFAVVNRATKPLENWDDYLASTIPEVVKFRDKYPLVTELAEELRGRIRGVSIHAAGVITSNAPIEEYAPIESREDKDDKVDGRVPVVAWDMNQCADAGFIKLDILGLNNLSVISDTVRFVKERHGVDIDPAKIPLDDPRVYKLLTDGYTKGVFQAEAHAYTQLLQEMRVENFAELAASNALVRPGARNTVGNDFIAIKNGDRGVQSLHPSVDKYLAETYGLVVYQEQVMQLAEHLGGLTGVEANKLRKIIGKKRDVSEFDAYKDKFIEGASEHIGMEKAAKLWHDFEAHAGYSFNKSHAVAYSMVSVQTAWLKINYPIEYMCSLFRNEEDKDKRTEILLEMKRMGISVQLPHLNRSIDKAVITEDGRIRLGLTDLKYISDKVYAHIEQHVPFESYAQFREIQGKKKSGININVVRTLDGVGAASFKDNPKTGNERDNLYDLLGVPAFNTTNVSDEAEAIITPLEFYDEKDTLVVQGMVKDIKRGKTAWGKGWARVEMIDETGTAGIFHDADTEITPGQMYVFLVAFNSIMAYVPVDDAHLTSTVFGKFINKERLNIGVGQSVILAVEKRFTRNKQMMATIVIANADREIKRVMVFPKQFSRNAGKMVAGKVIRPKIQQMVDRDTKQELRNEYSLEEIDD
jgi:DNA polymerase III subunit alpha